MVPGKDELPGSQPPTKKTSNLRNRVLLAVIVLIGFGLFYEPANVNIRNHSDIFTQYMAANVEERCVQTPFLRPHRQLELWEELGSIINGNPDFQQKAIDWISGAVQVRTESYDGMSPVEEDPSAWEHFKPFHQFLEKEFPLVYVQAIIFNLEMAAEFP
jgi:Gly-Xaa carboxypeptidase